MTARTTEPRMKVGPDVPDGTPRPLAATVPHFRIIDGTADAGVHVLYLPGAHIPAAHAGLPTVPAVQRDGCWVADRKAKP